MSLLKRFRDFLLRNSIGQQDYLVGYDSTTGEEIRIKASSLQGAAGASADIQFSADGSSWHYPISAEDIYIRIRVGSGAWNVARFVAGEVGTLSTSSTSQEEVENESLAGAIVLHKVAKTGSYNDLADKPTSLTDIQSEISPEDFGAFPADVSEVQEYNRGETLTYVLAVREDGAIIKVSIQDFADYINGRM